MEKVAEQQALKKRASFEDALRHNPAGAQQYLRYADWEIAQGQPALALAVLERCIAACPASAEPWLARLDVLRQTDPSAAETAALEATRQFPVDDRVWAKATETCKDQGNLRMIWAQWVDRDTDKMAGFIDFEQRTTGDHEIIGELYEHWTQVDPGAVQGWLGLLRHRRSPAEKNSVYSRALGALFMTAHDTPPKDRTLVVIEFAWVNPVSEDTVQVLAKLLGYPGAKLTAYEDIVISRELARVESRGFAVLSGEKRRQKYTPQYQPWALIANFRQAGSRAEVFFGYEHLLAQIPAADAAHAAAWDAYNAVALAYCLERESLSIYRRSIAASAIFYAPLHVQHAKLLLIREGPAAARAALAAAAAQHPSPEVFRFWVALEARLGAAAEGRRAYQQYLSEAPDPDAWKLALAFEARLGAPDSVRALFELALDETSAAAGREYLYQFWAAYELDRGTLATSQVVVTRWLAECKSVDAWSEAAYLKDGMCKYPAGSAVFEQAVEYFAGDKPSRDRLVERWLKYERAHGTPESVRRVELVGNPLAAVLSAPAEPPKAQPKKLSLFEKAQKWKTDRVHN